MNCRCGKTWSLVAAEHHPSTSKLRKLKAFVFDDEEFARSQVTSLLADRGYEVLAFGEAIACTECRAQKGQPCADIIISDVRMPGMTGIQFVQQQRKLGCFVPHVALISGAWSPTDLESASDLGCEIFHKPMPTKELGLWLENCERTVDRSLPLGATIQAEHPPLRRE